MSAFSGRIRDLSGLIVSQAVENTLSDVVEEACTHRKRVQTAGAEYLSCSTTTVWHYPCRGWRASFCTAGSPDPLSGPGKEGATIFVMTAARCPPLQRVSPRLSFSALVVVAVPEIK